VSPNAAMMLQAAKRFIDFLVCGLPSHKREGRLMAVFGAFSDDSGSATNEPIMVLAAVVAEHKVWRRFNDLWQHVLTTNKPLKPFKGDIYFKSYHAATLTGCFHGFTRKEADAKVNELTDIALKHMVYGMLSAVKWEHLKRFSKRV
jgi:hypothetical protein